MSVTGIVQMTSIKYSLARAYIQYKVTQRSEPNVQPIFVPVVRTPCLPQPIHSYPLSITWAALAHEEMQQRQEGG